MAQVRTQFLSESEVAALHDASLRILSQTGVVAHHDTILERLAAAGAQVDAARNLARLPERLVMDAVAGAGKRYILYGRDSARPARFGYGDLVLMSSPGQFGWIDMDTWQRRSPTVADLHNAIRLGDALPNVTIVGAMALPEEIPVAYRDVYLAGELVKGSSKPTRCFVANRKTARYILEIHRLVAGGAAALRGRPMFEAFTEPISPLQLPHDGFDVLIELIEVGMPASFAPMAMVAGTAPGTLAGTLAQENAEILAGVVITQVFAPGTPVMYGGIPHVMDPRTGICAFGSPEQGLMAVAVTQLARFYGFPVYINVGITDAKAPDMQAGLEKGATMVMGALAGADTFGHAGICGTDHGASLPWLVMDDEMMAYTRRITRGFEVDAEHLAVDLVAAVGPGGNFLAEEHTARHFRKELWLPGPLWTRQTWDGWEATGRSTMAERAVAEVRRILAAHQPPPIDEALGREVDRVVACARRELAGT